MYLVLQLLTILPQAPGPLPLVAGKPAWFQKKAIPHKDASDEELSVSLSPAAPTPTTPVGRTPVVRGHLVTGNPRYQDAIVAVSANVPLGPSPQLSMVSSMLCIVVKLTNLQNYSLQPIVRSSNISATNQLATLSCSELYKRCRIYLAAIGWFFTQRGDIRRLICWRRPSQRETCLPGWPAHQGQ